MDRSSGYYIEEENAPSLKTLVWAFLVKNHWMIEVTSVVSFTVQDLSERDVQLFDLR